MTLDKKLRSPKTATEAIYFLNQAKDGFERQHALLLSRVVLAVPGSADQAVAWNDVNASIEAQVALVAVEQYLRAKEEAERQPENPLAAGLREIGPG